jgi:hypothetical protein
MSGERKSRWRREGRRIHFNALQSSSVVPAKSRDSEVVSERKRMRTSSPQLGCCWLLLPLLRSRFCSFSPWHPQPVRFYHWQASRCCASSGLVAAGGVS